MEEEQRVRGFDNSGSKAEPDGRALKLDKRGMPLSPQPTDFKSDPLNWPQWMKISICLQASWMAMLGPMGSAIINPAFVPLSKAFNITIVQASYELTVFILFAAVGPVLFTPFANVYGRRPLYIASQIVAGVTNIAAAYSPTWGGLITTRVFNGMFAGIPVAIGAATISDCFYLHERGFYLGVYAWFFTNGAHFAPLFGGFIAQYGGGWPNCFAIPGYVQLGTFAVILFTLPETLYTRKQDAIHEEHSFVDLLLFRGTRLSDRRIHAVDFFRSFTMAKYVAIILPGIYYMTCFAWLSVLFAATGSQLFTSLYHFETYQTGLLLSIPLLIGTLIGESCSGWITDRMVYTYAKSHNGLRLPEARIKAAFLSLLGPIGLIIQGVCLSQHTPWIGVAVGMAISSFGLQVTTTVVYSYAIDCYKPQSAEISSLLNVLRQCFSCLVSFYAIPFGSAIGYQYAWLTLALINIVLWAAFMSMLIWGERIRQQSWQKPPTFHNDI